MRNILIVNLQDTGNEAEALRLALEYMNYFVALKSIGRPRDFIEVLNGKAPFDPDCVILSCHGEDGKILMPVLGEGVYAPDEPIGGFSSKEILQYMRLSEKTIISLGCTTGEQSISAAFSSNNNTYIAPSDYIEGSAALFFTIRLFYEMVSKSCDIRNAFLSAKETDNETRLFRIYRNGMGPQSCGI